MSAVVYEYYNFLIFVYLFYNFLIIIIFYIDLYDLHRKCPTHQQNVVLYIDSQSDIIYL